MRRFFAVALYMLAAQSALAAPIHPQLNSGLCLDVAGGSSSNGTAVQIAHCYGNAAQDWQRVGNTLRALGKCLDVTAGNRGAFTQLQLWDCGDGTNVNQQFDMGFGIIAWKNTGMCLDVPYANASDGQKIQTFPCSPSDKAQWWSYTSNGQTVPVSPAPPAAVASAPAQGASSAPPGGRLMTFVNQCSQTVWVALQNNGGKAIPSPSGFALGQGQGQSVALPQGWGGRMWGRTGCQVNGDSAKCDSGDTGGRLQPNGIGGQPATLAEFLFDGWAGGNGNVQDYYDGSLVDGYNLPMGIYPQGGTGVCKAPVCSANLLPNCPGDLQVKGSNGQTAVCLSSCTRYQTDETCCRGAHNTSATCPAPEGARYFKAACQDFYSYAYDDGTSTWNCTHPNGYKIVFCP